MRLFHRPYLITKAPPGSNSRLIFWQARLDPFVDQKLHMGPHLFAQILTESLPEVEKAADLRPQLSNTTAKAARRRHKSSDQRRAGARILLMASTKRSHFEVAATNWERPSGVNR